MSDMLGDIAELAALRRSLDHELSVASRRLSEKCVEARDDGVPVADIARALGVERQYVYTLIKRERARRRG